MSRDLIEKAVDNGLDRLMEVYEENPDRFLNEADIKCCLYHLLVNQLTLGGFDQDIVHSEMYVVFREVDPESGEEKISRHFVDLVVIAPGSMAPRTKGWGADLIIAIEIKHGFRSNKEGLEKDIEKLSAFRKYGCTAYLVVIDYRCDEEYMAIWDDCCREHGIRLRYSIYWSEKLSTRSRIQKTLWPPGTY